VDVICYGHIHVPLNEDVEGVRFVNGGQGYPSFMVPGTVAIIDTAPGGAFEVRIHEFAPAR
jgi:predicted phosphodiesterase